MVETWKESDLMNCLKCPIFWQTEVDEAECNKCGCHPKESEVKNNESV
jgi:hypothetical protein